MAKTIRDEDLRLNIIINGDNGRKEMGELERAIHDTNAKLETLYQKRKKLEAQGKQDTQAYRNLSAQIGKQTKAVEGYRERLAALHRQQSINSMTLSELRAHINRLNAVLAKTDPKTPLWRQLNAELKRSSARLMELRAQSKATGGAICTMAERANRYIGLITAGFASMAAVFSGISRAKQSFQDWDEAIANAMKTTQLSREEMLQLNESLKKIDTRSSQNELLGLARIAGKLGIEGQDNILEFVNAADKINIALGEDLGDNSEDTLREIGKLVDIFNLQQEFGLEQAMLKTGSAINSLGMASTANEGYIVEFTKRVAGIAPNADISIDKILGLAATLDKYGQMSETSATAIGQTIMGMFRRTDEFARVAHMSVKEFKDLLVQDTNEALLRVLEGMGNSGDGMLTVVQALDSLHLQGQRASTVLGSLAMHSDELRRQQELSNQAFTEGNSIIEEANIKNTTATAIMEKRKKAIVDEAVALGQTLTPAINVSLSAGTWLLKGLSALVTVGIKYRSILLALAAAYATNITLKKAKVAWTKLEVFWSAANRAALVKETTLLADATSGTMLLCAAKNLLAGNVMAASAAFKSFWASIGPIGWATLAVGALVGVISALRGRAKEAATSINAVERASKELDEALKDNDYGLGQNILTIKRLSQEWTALGNNLEAKKKFIKDNESAFDDLGIEISNVLGAEQLFVQNTPKFIEAMKLRAQASAAKKLAEEYYSKAAQASISRETAQKEYDDIPVEQRYTPTRNWVDLDGREHTSGGNLSPIASKKQNEISRLKEEEKTANDTADAFFNLAAAKDLAANAIIKEISPKPNSGGNGNNNGGGGGGDYGQKWSLNSDEEFLQKRLALKKEYQTSETMTEEEYNAKLLQLEIDALTARLKTNADSGADRVALEEDLADKLIQQKERTKRAEEKVAEEKKKACDRAVKDAEDKARKEAEIEMDIANMSGDRVAIEVANYEKLKRKYAGNAKALEALERAHQARLAKIKLDKVEDDIEQQQAAYKVARRMMESRHRQELESFKGSQRQLKEKRKEQWKELNDLDERYLTEMINQLTNLVNNGKIGDLDVGVKLSDEDKAKLLEDIAQLRDELAKLKGASGETEGQSFSGGGDFLGLSSDEWENMLDGNLQTTADWAEAIATIVSNVADMMMDLWGDVDKYMTAVEDNQLKEYEKNNEKKKKSLEKRFNSGLITEAQYNAEIEAMEAEHEAFQEELELKQAKRQKAMSITQSLINTAVGVTMSLTGMPWPINLIAAAATLAMGVAQTALIAATPITTGAEDGGPIGNGVIDVRREQDGKPFRARLNPNKRGFVSSPTVLVAENGMEYVLPNEVMQNPTAYPLLSAVETARQHGTLSSLDFSAIYSPYSIAGRVRGGFVSDATPTLMGSAEPTHSDSDVAKVLWLLWQRLQNPIEARVAMLGKNGLVEQTEKYNKVKSKGNIGG